jgi:hypothetical protein
MQTNEQRVKITKPTLVRCGQEGTLMRKIQPPAAYWVKFDDGSEHCFFDGELEVLDADE